MNTLEILIEARKLIEKPEAWTQGAFARGKDGFGRGTADESASCFCAAGALSRAAGGNHPIRLAWDYLDRASGGDITVFNDTHTHADVLSAFDRAIEAARAQVQP